MHYEPLTFFDDEFIQSQNNVSQKDVYAIFAPSELIIRIYFEIVQNVVKIDHKLRIHIFFDAGQFLI
ncbi:hypothetical protein MXB_5484 [Myxobolus squamalis]|nr:hypothetical protein MXB_5484 [Myxobolus squamalis]